MSTTVQGLPAPRAFKPTNAQVVQFLQEHAIFSDTRRYRELDRREAFQKCLEYKHQTVDWFGDPAEAFETISSEATFPAGTGPSGGPKLNARQKRPTAPTRKAKTTVQRFTDMLLSNARKPKVNVDQDEDTAAFLEAVQEAGAFWPAMRSARNRGGGMGSVIMTVHVREGAWSFEVHNSKHCTPIWKDRRTWTLAGLLIMYKTQREEQATDDDGKPVEGTRMVDYLVRRIITENDDIVYEEISVEDAQANPGEAWRVDGDLAVNHNLGKFPGVWIQNISDEEDQDGGGGDCEGAFETIDTNDRLIAQAFFGTLPNLDPTVVTKTDPHEVQAVDALNGLQKGSEFAIEVGSKGDAKYMEMTGAGVTTALALSEKLERQIDLITGAVFPDDTDIAQAQSAKAIELRFAPMISRCDDLRGQYGAAILSLMRIVVFIAKKFLGASVQLPPGPNGEPRIGRFRFDMPPRKTQVKDGDGMKDVVAPHKLGPGGYMSLEWGAYFAPTENDIQQMVQNSSAANASGFITKVTAARRIAKVFGVQDIEGEVAAAREEGQADAERSLYGAEGGVRMEKALVQDPSGEGQAEKSPGAGQGGKP